MVLKMRESVCGEWPERRWRGGRHTNAPACGSTSLGRQWWTRYEESKYVHGDNSAAVSL